VNKNSKIYVAGHLGLLGSALLRKLKEHCFTNVITRARAQLDLTDKNAVNSFFRDESPEYVFLAAGLTGGILANKTRPADFLHINLAIQDNVFDASSKCKVKNLVFYGSSCVYPKNTEQPIKEESLLTGEIEETSEAYAIAKTCGLLACRAYNRQFKSNNFIALVPNSMYGPNDDFDHDNSHVLAALISKIHRAKLEGQDIVQLWGSGTPRREFIFCDDVADASIFAALSSSKLDNTHYNIGSGTDYSIKELANIIAEVIQYDGAIEWDKSKPDGVMRKKIDSSRFNDLGWKPKVSLIDGINMTYDWFLDQNKRVQ